MEVHICTFQIKVTTVKVCFTPKSIRQSLEAVVRGEKGQIIVVGAIRSMIKNGLANFNEIFEIKTDLIRDPISNTYQPSSLLLQIRNAGQALNEKISSSICKFSLSEMLSNSQLHTVQLQTQDKCFVANLEVKCLQIVNNGLRKTRKLSSKDRQLSQVETVQINRLQRSLTTRSKQGKSRSRSRENVENEKGRHQQSQEQLRKLRDQLNSQQVSHIMTSQALRNAHLQLIQHEQVINELSALISQKETDIIQLNQRLENAREESEKLKEENKTVSTVLKEIDILEFKNFQLQEHILTCQRQIQELKQTQKQANQKEKELKIAASKQKEINIFLSKSIDQFKRDLGRKQQEVTLLNFVNKSNETEITKLKEELKVLTENYYKTQTRLKEDLQQNRQKFNQLYEKYSKLKDQNSSFNNMITNTQMEERQKQYVLKIKEFQQKQLSLKDHVQNIEKEMIDLEDILQQKEDNQLKLIEHSRKLQIQIERLEVQNKILATIFPKDEPQTLESKDTSQQCVILKKKVNRLLLILRENSNILLQSQKNKRQLAFMQRQQRQNGQRLSVLRDQSKQLKQRLTVLLKENKKLIEKMHKIQKQNENLQKSNQNLTKQFKVVKEKQKTALQDYQILNYRMSLFQKQLNQLKAKQKDQEIVISFTENFQLKSIDGEYGMGVINQMSQQFVSSRPHSRKGYQHQKQQFKYFNAECLHEISSLMVQRKEISDKFCASFRENVSKRHIKQRKYQLLQKQSCQLARLATQIKRFLIQKNEKEVAIRCELQVKKVIDQVNKLQMENN